MKSTNSLKEKIERLTPMKVFLTISGVGIVLFLLYAIAFGHISFTWMCMASRTRNSFLDYFRHVLFMADPAHLYENATGVWGCFPPLIYTLYFLLYSMTAFVGITPGNWRALMQVDEAMTVFLYYSVIVIVAMLLAIQLWQKRKGAFRLFLCLIMSAPFFAGIERGNSVILVFALLLFVMKLRDSETKLKRELALILIAICAAIKIYPAVFGFLYIKERRYKEGFRLLAYGILFFFVPFVFFGGKNGFLLWLSNVGSATVTYSVGRIEFIRGIVMTVSYFTTGATSDYLSLIIPNIFLIFMLSLFFITANRYRAVFYLCVLMVFYPTNAYRYSLCLLAIPLVIYLMEHGDEKLNGKLQLVEIILFGLVFTIPTLFGLLTNFQGSLYPDEAHLTLVELRLYIAAYVLWGVIVGHDLVDIFKHKQLNKNLLKSIDKYAA